MAVSSYQQGIILVELPPESDIRAQLDKLSRLLRGTDNDVVIDFSKVDIMTSLTLSCFLKVREQLVQADRRLIFVNVSSVTKDIFAVTCSDGILEFADDTNQALASLAKDRQCDQSVR